MKPEDPELVISVEGEVARLTFNRPDKRNAISHNMWLAVIEGLADLAESEAVRVLVVAGAGGTFSSGADLREVKAADKQKAAEHVAVGKRGVAAIRSFPRPTVALIDGACFGAGCNVALACDVRFASPRSTFGFPAVRRGFVQQEPFLTEIIDAVGPGQAARLLLSSATISGPEAARVGFVDHCSDEYEAAAETFVSATAAADPSTVAATRALIRGR